MTNVKTVPEAIDDAEIDDVQGGGTAVGNPGKLEHLNATRRIEKTVSNRGAERKLMSGSVGGTNV